MPIDALFLHAAARELRPRLTGSRVDKIQQPERDVLLLSLRGPEGPGKLLISAGSGTARMHFTTGGRENPAEPPMFCMLLRKHLAGGRITAIHQPPMERLAELEVDITDDFGRQGRRWLVLEAMGRSSNIILLDEERRIVDCLRRVDGDLSEARLWAVV